MLDEFSNTIINGENHNLENAQDNEGFAEADEEHKNMKGVIGGEDIIQLKSSFIPKWITPLEKLFCYSLLKNKIMCKLNNIYAPQEDHKF